MTNEHQATVNGRSLPISPKMSMIICREIRGKKVQHAKHMLEHVVTLKKPLPFKKFNKDLGHKPGMGPARYPVNASKLVLQLLHSLEANAENKGLNKERLIITEAIANFADRKWHMGRQRRTKIKSSHVTISAVEEKTPEKKEAQKK